MNKLPGGALASRPLHFFWIVDCSGSMAGKKMQELNFAIKESLPEMRKVAEENPNAQVLCALLPFLQARSGMLPVPHQSQSFAGKS